MQDGDASLVGSLLDQIKRLITTPAACGLRSHTGLCAKVGCDRCGVSLSENRSMLHAGPVFVTMPPPPMPTRGSGRRRRRPGPR